MKIRSVIESDAEAFAQFLKELASETKFMLPKIHEVFGIDVWRQRFSKNQQNGNSKLFIADAEDEIVGFISVQHGLYERSRFTASIVIGILTKYHRQGLGYSLMQTVEKWAHEKSLHRLELSVVSKNTAAIALYKKCDFIIEGTKKESFCSENNFYDEYVMGKIL